jgi:putative hemolysin
MTEVTIEIVAIMLLILLNGFFAMVEMAVVSSRRVRLQTRAAAGDRNAMAALRLSESPDKLFSTVQIGITLVGILTGAFGGATLAEKLEGYFSTIPAMASYSEAIGLGLVVVPITYLTLILGELVPKRLAFSYPETLAGFSAPVMGALMWLSLPVVKLLGISTTTIIRILGLDPSKEPTVTEEEIRGMIGEGARAGVLEHVEKDMLERIIRLGDRQVRTIMTHRSKVVWLDLAAPWEENIRKIKESPFSRFPVGRGDLSNIIGILKAKDLLATKVGKDGSVIKDCILQPLYVPETMRALRLLELFKRQLRMHFAVIIDEHGDVQGIITLNDILEAIVGDIASEGEDSEPGAVQREDGSWLMDALLPMDEVFSILGLRPDDEREGETQQTLAGFILKHMGEIPIAGQYIDRYNYRFEVVDMDGKRIDAVMVSILRGQKEAAL